MFDFFAALFGGGYVLNKISNSKAADRYDKIRKNDYFAIVDKVTNTKFEWDYRYRLNIDRYASYEEEEKALALRRRMISEINKDDMKEIFGAGWEELFEDIESIPYTPLETAAYPECFKSIMDVAFEVWLSQKGYISDVRCSTAYSSQFVLAGLRSEYEQDRRVFVINNAAKIIERNVKKHHPNLNIHLVQREIFRRGGRVGFYWNFYLIYSLG